MQSQNMEIDSIKQAFKQYEEISKQRQKNEASINEMSKHYKNKKNKVLINDDEILKSQIER
jgi:hypothetical protein